MKKVTIKSAKIILSIGRFFACVPFEESSCFFLKKIYPVVWLAIDLGCISMAIIGRLKHTYPFEITNLVMALASDVVLVACTIVRLVFVNFVHHKEHLSIHEHLEKLEKAQNFIHLATHNDIKGFIFMTIGFCVFLVCNLILFTQNLEWFVWFFIMRELANYQLLVSTSIMKTYMLIINSHFELINYSLHNLAPKYFLGDHTFNRSISHQIQMLSEQYIQLTVIIRYFNQVYGVYLVLVYICMVINFLVPINIAILYGGGHGAIGGMDGSDWGPIVGLLAIVWCMLPWMTFRDLFYTGENVTGEIEKIPENCYRIMFQMADKYRNEMKELALETAMIRPVFTAGGWFEVNYKMILPTITMIISYLIVLIQYHG